jgi:hypothetical protein
MAKYQIIAVLLTPSGNYTETECPKGYADYMALDKAYETDDFDSMESILSNYEIENGAVEEHETNADYIVDCDADGFYLLRKISEPKTTYTDNDMEEVIADIMSYIEQTEDINEREEYKRELEEVKGEWSKLVDSGVFHDAIGQVVKKDCYGTILAVEVVTEY